MKQAPDFTQKIERLYIMVRGAEEAKTFFRSFNSELILSLRERGIEAQYYYFEPLSLDSDEDILNNINKFKANIVMMINQTETRNAQGKFFTRTSRISKKCFKKVNSKIGNR